MGKKKNNNLEGHGLQHLTPERRREIQSMGGKANKNNPKVRLSRKLTWMKRKGLTDDSAREIWDLMTESDLSSLDVLMLIKKMQKNVDGDDQAMNIVVGRLMDWHKMHHGNKSSLDVKVASVNLNEPLNEETIKAIFEEVGE